jgi:hypothetical protein
MWLWALCACTQLVASGFVYAMSLALFFRRSVVTSPRRRYIYAGVVSFLIACATWATEYTRLPDATGVNAIFSAGFYDPVRDVNSPFHIFGKDSRFVALFVYFLVKFTSVVFSLTMPMPCGVFLPLLAVSG